MKTLKRNIFVTRVIALLSLLTLFGSCKKDTYYEVKGVCPLVLSTNPANLKTNVPLDQTITVTFNEKMDPATMVQANFSLSGTTTVLGNLSYDANSTSLHFVPTASLEPNTTYIGKVRTGAKDLNGNALQQEYTWTFSTGNLVSAMVISTDPAAGETGVILNKVISATFNLPMNASTINQSTFLLGTGTASVGGTITYSNNTAYFTPNTALSAGAIYTATLTSAVQKGTGTNLLANYTWSFTAGTSSAPTVLVTDPLNNATAVPLNKIITAVFSEAMDAATINGTTFLLKKGNTSVIGTLSMNGSTLSFNVTGGLSSGSIYTATITTGAKNLSGTALLNDYVWSFSTIPALGGPVVDLKTVERFGIIAGVGVSNNAGFSEIHDLDVGISPGVRSSVTGFPPAVIVNGALYASDDLVPIGTAAMLVQAKLDLTAAYLFAEGATSPAPATVSGDLGGTTLAPGIYKSTSTLLIQSGDLTLDAQGDPNAVWIFQIASAFTTVGGAGGNVILAGGAQAKNIFWQTGSSATIGDFTQFKGNVLALTSITMNTAAKAEGRMLARNGSVVMTSSNIITKP